MPGRVNKNIYWRCICECGNERILKGTVINKGIIKSCGCMQGRWGRNCHGMRNTPEYNAWCAMRDRCYNSNYEFYRHYGGRGIAVCSRWRWSFENFFADMGKRPSPLHSLDRIRVNGNYTPKNCRWATKKEQGGNKRNNRWIEFDGKKMILNDWAKYIGIGHGHLRNLLKKYQMGYVVQNYKK